MLQHAHIVNNCWVTADGEIIPIPDLSDAHLNNVMWYLRRSDKTPNVIRYLEIIEKEWDKRDRESIEALGLDYEEYKRTDR